MSCLAFAFPGFYTFFFTFPNAYRVLGFLYGKMQLLSVLLCLPHGNADCERVFSQLRKINAEYKKRMKQKTLTALLLVKMNCDDHCFQFSATKDTLCAEKEATKAYNQQHLQ